MLDTCIMQVALNSPLLSQKSFTCEQCSEALNRKNRSSSEAQQIFHVSGFLVAMTEVQSGARPSRAVGAPGALHWPTFHQFSSELILSCSSPGLSLICLSNCVALLEHFTIRWSSKRFQAFEAHIFLHVPIFFWRFLILSEEVVATLLAPKKITILPGKWKVGQFYFTFIVRTSQTPSKSHFFRPWVGVVLGIRKL